MLPIECRAFQDLIIHLLELILRHFHCSEFGVGVDALLSFIFFSSFLSFLIVGSFLSILLLIVGTFLCSFFFFFFFTSFFF